MKKISILLLSVFALGTTFTSCSSDDDNTVTQSNTLELSIGDISATDVTSENPQAILVPGATVNVYSSRENWLSNTNPKTAISDANGKVTFDGLKVQDYYVDIVKSDYLHNGSYEFPVLQYIYPVKAGNNKYNGLIMENTPIQFINNSGKNFIIYYANGVLNGNSGERTKELLFGALLKTNTSKKLGLPLGTYEIRAYEVDDNGNEISENEYQSFEMVNIEGGSTEIINLQ